MWEGIKNLCATLYYSKRIRSFLWRTAMIAFAGVLGLAAQELALIEEVNSTLKALIVVIGLVFGEISKAINNYFSRV